MLKICIACLLALGATGCTKLIYDRLDLLAAGYLNDLVSLDSEQRQALRGELSRMLAWHRSSELVRYGAFVRELADEVAAPGGREMYERAALRAESFGHALLQQAAPDAARLLMSLSPTQLDELDNNLEKRAAKQATKADEALANGEWRKQRARRLQRQLKRWTGAVTQTQKRLIEDGVARLEPNGQAWRRSERRFRNALLDALRSQPATQHEVLLLLQHPDTQWTEEYNSRRQAAREQLYRLLGALDASLSASQRKRLRRELTEFAEQLVALGGRGQ